MITDSVSIHIGYHKTGSTFLQKRIFPAMNLKQAMLSMDEISKTQDYDEKRLLELAQSTYGIRDWNQDVVISQESLVGHKDGYPIWNGFTIAKNLKTTFPNAKILIVVRNQLDYILSLYTFEVFIKGLERRSLSNYLQHNYSINPGLREHLQYDKLVVEYQNLFGRENVFVMAYESLKENHVDFISGIAEFIGTESPSQYKTGRVNEGTRERNIIQISRFLNYPYSLIMQLLIHYQLIPAEQANPPRLSKAYMLLRNKLINPVLISTFSSKKQHIEIPENWNDYLFPIFAESNKRLCNLVEINLEQLGYPL